LSAHTSISSVAPPETRRRSLEATLSIPPRPQKARKGIWLIPTEHQMNTFRAALEISLQHYALCMIAACRQQMMQVIGIAELGNSLLKASMARNSLHGRCRSRHPIKSQPRVRARRESVYGADRLVRFRTGIRAMEHINSSERMLIDRCS
jgi:hypothetical protein